MDWLTGPLNNAFSVLNSNQIVSSVISLFLILYAGLAAPKLHPNMAGLFQNTWFKIIIVTLVIFMIMKKDAGTSILLAVCFVLSLQTITKLTTSKVLDKQNNMAEDLAKQVVTETPTETSTETSTETPTETSTETSTETPTEKLTEKFSDSCEGQKCKYVESDFSKCKKNQKCYKNNNALDKLIPIDKEMRERNIERFTSNSCSGFGNMDQMTYVTKPENTRINELIRKDTANWVSEPGKGKWGDKPSISYTGPCESEHAVFKNCTSRVKGECEAQESTETVEKFSDGPDNTCTEFDGPYRYVKKFSPEEGTNKDMGVMPPQSSSVIANNLETGCKKKEKSVVNKAHERQAINIGGGGHEKDSDYSVKPISYDLLEGKKFERPMHKWSFKKIKKHHLKKGGIVHNRACSSKPSGFDKAFTGSDLDAEMVNNCEYGCNPYKAKSGLEHINPYTSKKL
jgi:hypothetical protein